jgi:hypothetical protein
MARTTSGRRTCCAPGLKGTISICHATAVLCRNTAMRSIVERPGAGSPRMYVLLRTATRRPPSSLSTQYASRARSGPCGRHFHRLITFTFSRRSTYSTSATGNAEPPADSPNSPATRRSPRMRPSALSSGWPLTLTWRSTPTAATPPTSRSERPPPSGCYPAATRSWSMCSSVASTAAKARATSPTTSHASTTSSSGSVARTPVIGCPLPPRTPTACCHPAPSPIPRPTC